MREVSKECLGSHNVLAFHDWNSATVVNLLGRYFVASQRAKMTQHDTISSPSPGGYINQLWTL